MSPVAGLKQLKDKHAPAPFLNNSRSVFHGIAGLAECPHGRGW